MPNHTAKPPLGEISPQGQPAPQAERPLRPYYATTALAERHETLWLSLSSLHNDIVAPNRPITIAIVMEPLSSSPLFAPCAPGKTDDDDPTQTPLSA